ncbi:MAG: hypothetical protein M5U18_14550 [Dehalococcoidia bacterium]|nr:hypothetical protein [Dehalococcoidia bacterium]
MGAKAHMLEGLMEQWPGPAAGGGSAASGAGGGGTTPRGGSAGGAGGAGRSFLKVGSVLAVSLVVLLLVPQSPIALTRNDSGAIKLADTAPGDGGVSPPLPPRPRPRPPPPPPTTAAVSPSPTETPASSPTPATGAGNTGPTATHTPVPCRYTDEGAQYGHADCNTDQHANGDTDENQHPNAVTHGDPDDGAL